MEKIVILGATGGCVDILDAILDVNAALNGKSFEVLGFLDDKETLWGTKILGAEVLGPFSSASEFLDCKFITGVGSPENFWQREDIIRSLGIPLNQFATIIHPTASISSSAKIGQGSVIFQNVTITTNSVIGDQVLILPNSVVSHDTVVSDFSILNAGVCLAGAVTVGRSCYIGSNCSIRQDINIGAKSLIGMGSVVVRDVDERVAVVGNPANYLKPIE